MGRTPNGDGYPRRQADGSWAQWLDCGYREGKRIRKRVTGATKDAVKIKIAEMRMRLERGEDITTPPPLPEAAIPPTPRTVTMLLDAYVARSKWRKRTKATYTYLIDKHITPTLGPLSLDKLIARHIRQLFEELKTKLSPRTIHIVKAILRGALAWAVEEEWMASNVARDVKAPTPERSPARSLTHDEAKAFLEALIGERLAVALRLMLSLGLRRGEAAGLRVNDFDPTTGILTIYGTMGYIPGEGLVWGETKSENGIRRIKLPARLAAAMRWYLAERGAEALAMGWEDSPYLFRAENGGGVLNPGQLYKIFQRVRKRAGLAPCRPHDLRHSCATFLIAEGMPIPAVAAYIGDTPDTVRRHYAHALPGQVDEMAEKMDAILDRPTKKDKDRAEEA